MSSLSLTSPQACPACPELLSLGALVVHADVPASDPLVQISYIVGSKAQPPPLLEVVGRTEDSGAADCSLQEVRCLTLRPAADSEPLVGSQTNGIGHKSPIRASYPLNDLS